MLGRRVQTPHCYSLNRRMSELCNEQYHTWALRNGKSGGTQQRSPVSQSTKRGLKPHRRPQAQSSLENWGEFFNDGKWCWGDVYKPCSATRSTEDCQKETELCNERYHTWALRLIPVWVLNKHGRPV